ncbi:MAG: signal peptidase I [Mycobacteriaceae bacterium]|nr:signal peptidase I [Mycobacteriaceae bacterium]
MVADAASGEPSRRSRRAKAGASKRKAPKKQRPLWQEIPILLLIAMVLSFLLQTFIARVYLIPSQSMEPTLHGCPGCVGDRIVVQKLSYDFGKPKPGDVVVFKAPSSSWDEGWVSTRSHNAVIRSVQNFGSLLGLVPPDENDLVKRVVATGGQTVKCCDARGRVEVDGKALDEPYVQSDGNAGEDKPGDFVLPQGVTACTDADPFRAQRCFSQITVPDGNVWVMGDNRANSRDSRYHVVDQYQGTVPISDIRGKAVFRIWPLNRIGTISSPNPQSK